MPEGQQNLPPPPNRIGMILAVVLTAGIVIAVFWKTRTPDTSQNNDPNSSQADPQNFGAGIDDGGENNFRAYAGLLVLDVSGKPADSFIFRMRLLRLLDDETRSLNFMRQALVRDPNIGGVVDLTSDQLDLLRTIDPPNVIISDADREKIVTLWHAWEKADEDHKAAAQQAILDALTEVSKDSLAPTKQAWIDAANSVRHILTVEQQVKLAVYAQNGAPSLPSSPLLPRQ
jgi:hypothetical protein